MDNTPILSPLLALLRSRKVIVSTVVFIVALLVQQFPVLVPMQGTLISLLAVFGVAVIGGISLEDAAKYVGQRGYTPVVSVNPPQTPEEDLRQLMNDIIDERVNPGVLVAPSPVVVAPADNSVPDTTVITVESK